MARKSTTPSPVQRTQSSRVQPVRPAAVRKNGSVALAGATGSSAVNSALPGTKNTKPPMNKTKRNLIIALSILLVVLLSAGTAFALYINYINEQLRGSLSNEDRMAIQDELGYGTSLDKPFYMMLLGSDRRDGEKGIFRSDTNIVVRVDPQEKVVSMISIPRDTKINIEKHGTQKFNAAYAFGGPAGAIREAKKLLGVDISHYAEVSFMSLPGLVDAVGGITVENESRINNYKCDDGDGNHYIIEKGTQRLNGGQALTFARNRDYPDGDFTRTKHQRAVIEAIAQEVLKLPITSMPGVIEAGLKCVETDLNVADLIGLAQMFTNNDKELKMYSALVPSYTQNINGISFVINDPEKTAEMIKIFKEGGDPSVVESNRGAAKDIIDKSVDTSNVLVLPTDEEAGQSGIKVTKPTDKLPGASSSGSSSSGSSSSNTTGSSSGSSTGGSTSGGTTSGGSTGGGDSSGGSNSGGSGSSSGSGSGGTTTGSGGITNPPVDS